MSSSLIRFRPPLKSHQKELAAAVHSFRSHQVDMLNVEMYKMLWLKILTNHGLGLDLCCNLCNENFLLQDYERAFADISAVGWWSKVTGKRSKLWQAALKEHVRYANHEYETVSSREVSK